MMISINKKKCSSCGFCVKECIRGVYKQTDDEVVVVRPKACYYCGHCIAVCPRDAIEHSKMEYTQIEKPSFRSDDLSVDYKNIVRLRRSVRNYKDKDVSRKLLEEILDVPRYSPTAHNLQDVEYIVITDKNILNDISKILRDKFVKYLTFIEKPWVRIIINLLMKIPSLKMLKSFIEDSEYYKELLASGRDVVFYNAPSLILLYAKPSPLAEADCYIAATNIINHTVTLGLGTCFIGVLTKSLRFNKALVKMLGIPPKRKLFVALTCGYPEYKFIRTVARKPISITWK